MAINKYYTPKQSQYLPATFDIYSNYYQQQGAAYDQGMTSIDNLYTELGKMKAFKPEDEQRLFERKKYYEDRLNGLIESSNGKPMQMMPGLRDINREFINDLSSGPLAEINSNYARAANDYSTYQKKVGEGKWDAFTQLMAQKSIGTGMVFPDSPDKMKIIKENVNDELANNMDFNSLTGVVAQTLLSDPSVMQQGQMVASLFGEDSEYYKEWESNLLSTATSGALSKYKYSDKLQEMFDKLIDTKHVQGISDEELAAKARWAAEAALIEHSDYRQSLAQFAGPNGDKILEQYDKAAYDMALRTALIKRTEADAKTTDGKLTPEFILNNATTDVYDGLVYAQKEFNEQWRNFSMEDKITQAKQLSDTLGLVFEKPEMVNQNPPELQLINEFNLLMRNRLGILPLPEDGDFLTDTWFKDKFGKGGSQSMQDMIYLNALPATQSIPTGFRPQFQGRDLVEWEKDVFGDEKRNGDLAALKTYISDSKGNFMETSGESTYEQIAKQMGVKVKDAKTRGEFIESLKQTDKGTYFPFMWNGKEWMFGVVMFNAPSSSSGKEFKIGVEIDQEYSRALRKEFEPILTTLGKSEMEKYKDFKDFKGKGFVKNYSGPGNYTVEIPEKVLNIEYDGDIVPAVITEITVNTVALKDANGAPIRDGNKNVVYETTIVPKVYSVTSDGKIGNEIQDDFSVKGFDKFMNTLVSGFMNTQKTENGGKGYADMLNIKTDLIK